MRDDEMTDAALDEEIAQALSVDPSPELVLRIRRRVETERVLNLWAASWLSWTLAASGAVVVGAMAFAVARHGGAAGSVPPLVARSIPYASADAALGGPSWRGVTLPVARVGAGMRDTDLKVAPATARLEWRATPRADSTPEILVDPREARAAVVHRRRSQWPSRLDRAARRHQACRYGRGADSRHLHCAD